MGIETLAIASIAATVIGGGMSAVGAAQGGAASKASYTYQSQVAANNKIIADRNAEYAIAAGETEAQMMGMKTKAQIGQTLATQGAKGLDVNSGSPLAVRESEAEIGSFNEMMIRHNAGRQAYGAKIEGMNAENQGRVATAAGNQASRAGQIGALSSIVGSAASVSSKWLGYSRAGVGSDDSYSNLNFDDGTA